MENQGKRELSIHAALGEMKKLTQRMEQKVSAASFIGAKKRTAAKVEMSTLTAKEFGEQANAALQSYEDCMKEYVAIKSAVVLSNATTKVLIGAEEMLVASAIERKTTIKFEKALLRQLKYSRNNIVAQVQKKNDNVEEKLNQQIEVLTANSSNKASTLAELEGFCNQFRNSNCYEVVTGFDIDKKIAELEESILDFETNVDVALSNSNAITKIYV